MPRLYLSGIVGTGKTEAIQETKELAKRTCGKEVYNVSLGEIFAEFGDMLDVPRDRLNYLPNIMQAALRTGLMDRCALELMNYDNDDMVIIDGPLTIVDRYGINQGTFRINEFETLNSSRIRRPIDRRFVSMIGDTQRIVQKNKGMSYPTDSASILEWVAREVQISDLFSEYYTKEKVLVTPRDYSSQLLLKLLIDKTTPVAYFAYPITEVRRQEMLGNCEVREKLNDFRDELNLCCSFVNPIELSDSNITNAAERIYTRYRDLNWLVRQAKYVIAYFPADLQSKGIPIELKESENLGRVNILIHPEADENPLDAPIDFYFKDGGEFIDAVRKSRTDNKFKRLEEFLDKDSDMLRYEKLFKGISINKI